MHFLGQGVPRDIAKGMQWMSKAVDIGGVTAMYEVAAHYGKGMNGVPQDFKEAIKWTRKAAELGHHRSMWRLGQMIESSQGSEGTLDEAIYWYKKATECPNRQDFATIGLAKAELDRLLKNKKTPNLTKATAATSLSDKESSKAPKSEGCLLICIATVLIAGVFAVLLVISGKYLSA